LQRILEVNKGFTGIGGVVGHVALNSGQVNAKYLTGAIAKQVRILPDVLRFLLA
jgi:hypothetical protein